MLKSKTLKTTSFLILIISILSILFLFAPNIEAESFAYLGGMPVGLSIEIEDLLIINKTTVLTKEGYKEPFLNIEIQEGDVLEKINNKKVSSIKEVENSVKDGKIVDIEILRGNKSLNYKIQPELDMISNKYKLGLLLQNKITGIGTVTYIKQNGEFAALGHSIKYIGDKTVSATTGDVYDAKIIDCKKGIKGKAGELNGIFIGDGLSLGKVNKTNEFGVYGKMNKKLDNLYKTELGGKKDVELGAAKLYSTIEGMEPKFYDIEIIRAYSQSTPKDKSMVIRITDKELINKTGGIVQGMSGSPIVQNGKIIGAITHVFVADPTKGFGIYLDWMK